MPQIVPSQVATFKFQTPLRAKVLNTLISDVATEGLLTRPSLRVGNGNQGQIFIGKFGAIVRPVSKVNGLVMEQSAVKVTTTEETSLLWNPPAATDYTYYRDSPCAVGLMYEFEEANAEGVPVLVLLYPNTAYDDGDDKMKIGDFNGVIVCTIQHKKDEDDNKFYTCLSTYGADISSSLMAQDGWNPDWFLSPKNPRTYNFTDESTILNSYSTWSLYTQGGVFPANPAQWPGAIIQPSCKYDVTVREPLSYNTLVYLDLSKNYTVSLYMDYGTGIYIQPSKKVIGTVFSLSSREMNDAGQSVFYTNFVRSVVRMDEMVPIAFNNGILDIG